MFLPERSPYTHHPGRRPRLLDLMCGAGGASVGYWLAGFEVVGVDIEPQRDYPFRFLQADALKVLRSTKFMRQFDAVHLSPPCQYWTGAASLGGRSMGSKERAAYDAKHPDLIGPARKLVRRTGLPYVIENVMGSPLRQPIKLCGSMFGLQVMRHRLFESNIELVQPACNHKVWVRSYPRQPGTRKGGVPRVIGVYGHGMVTRGNFNGTDVWRWAMQMPWVRGRKGLAEAIPPPYTEFVGWQLMDYLYGVDDLN